MCGGHCGHEASLDMQNPMRRALQPCRGQSNTQMLTLRPRAQQCRFLRRLGLRSKEKPVYFSIGLGLNDSLFDTCTVHSPSRCVTKYLSATNEQRRPAVALFEPLWQDTGFSIHR